MRGLITLIIDSHVDNYLTEIFVFVSYGSVVNIWPQNDFLGTILIYSYDYPGI